MVDELRNGNATGKWKGRNIIPIIEVRKGKKHGNDFIRATAT